VRAKQIAASEQIVVHQQGVVGAGQH